MATPSPAPRPIAVITGASAGIGLEIARVLASRGFDLVLSARREPALLTLASELTSTHDTHCDIVPLDLADPASPRRLFDRVAGLGRPVEVLVNNAGFGDLGPVAEADAKKLLAMVQVNVTALTELTLLFLPAMMARKQGRVLNVGSIAGFQPGPGMAVYYATKAYVNSFSEAVASEVMGTGVSVTCLCPGPTPTEFATAAGMPEHLFNQGGVTSASYVAETAVRAMFRGKRLVIPGWRNRLLMFAEWFVPRGVVIAAVKRMQTARQSAKPPSGEGR